MKTYKITVVLENVVADDTDEEAMKESVKEALTTAIEMDDNGLEELPYDYEEEYDDCF